MSFITLNKFIDLMELLNQNDNHIRLIDDWIQWVLHLVADCTSYQSFKIFFLLDLIFNFAGEYVLRNINHLYHELLFGFILRYFWDLYLVEKDLF